MILGTQKQPPPPKKKREGEEKQKERFSRPKEADNSLVSINLTSILLCTCNS